jgi:fructose-bisphosphate aldolase, class II
MKTLREVIQEARERRVAIGHFNVSNLEGFHAVVGATRELDLPVIIGVSEGERDFFGLDELVSLVKLYREKHGITIFANADHSYSFERVQDAIDAGFDMVIFDGVKLSHDENIEVTKKCVEYAKASGRDIIVEAELGNIGQSSKVLEDVPEGVATSEKFLTSVEDAKAFVEATGVDALAPAVGNMHGILKGGKNPEINTERIAEIEKATGVPLVLHGGSGISDEDFRTAIKAGISVVHVNTELRIAFKDGLETSLAANKDDIAPYRYMKPALEAMKAKTIEKLELFNGQ